jgi:hypothetical protein
MPFPELFAIGVPILVILMFAAAIIHAGFPARKPAPAKPLLRPAVIIVCLIHLLFAGIIYRYLILDGWLTNPYYHWTDPDDINLVLAISEPLCVLAVIALVATRKPFFYKLLLDLLIIQFLFAAGFITLIIWFTLTWQPRLF